MMIALPLAAETMPAPTGDVVLTVSGEITQDNANGTVQLDMDMIREMDPIVFTTSTIWQNDPVEFTGVSLKALLDKIGATGTSIGAIALNDYKVDIPVDSMTDTAPIIAYLMDGETMSPRDKGPLWVVYPYDSATRYRTEVIYSRSIWQLDRIVLE
jgi:hypothetical protein